MQLTQKETSLIKDLKDQEKLCVDKYRRYANAAHDPQLKTLFSQIADTEQGHYDTLSSIESGNTPTMSGSASPVGKGQSFSATYGMADTQEKRDDCYLCSDLLATEKHAAGLYNTCVFEFAQPPLRQILNHIQTEEQGHGESLYGYMKANGMYS